MSRKILPSLLLLLACGDKESGDAAAKDSAPTDTGFCADAPIATWNSFGDAFITRNCQPCHASTTVNRYEAPLEVTFDTVDEVWAQADRVLARAATDPPTMPPEGGTTDDDRYLLTAWLTCATPGT